MLFNFLVATLAAWRLASLIRYEDGPYRVFARIRSAIGIIEDQHSTNTPNELAKMVACFWCLSIWIALPVSIIAFGVDGILYIPAVSGGAIVINTWVRSYAY